VNYKEIMIGMAINGFLKRSTRLRMKVGVGISEGKA
jgi:hypothetical protein